MAYRHHVKSETWSYAPEDEGSIAGYSGARGRFRFRMKHDDLRIFMEREHNAYQQHRPAEDLEVRQEWRPEFQSEWALDMGLPK